MNTEWGKTTNITNFPGKILIFTKLTHGNWKSLKNMENIYFCKQVQKIIWPN